ncbi:hypothetical protein BG011_005850 [Mortierella polycephala]|uniref:Uncharacterized protein n=1 Tax=Mortierella polycephala TaxID=41804 RepID=A0A9P6QDV4_9FUNG|nr:hypothetical protein BG011_005850 [Mortierella polycephala]
MTKDKKRAIAVLGIGALFAYCCVALVSGQESTLSEYRTQGRIISLAPDHAFYDSSEFEASELSATAVSPFCKSFAFLCHIRCLQRGDSKNPANTHDGEINRCTHIPDSDSIRVLCRCNNGADITAEVSYALEGVIDIKAAGGDGTGPGEAGQIRQVVYGATKTITRIAYRTVTTTITPACTSPPQQGAMRNEILEGHEDAVGDGKILNGLDGKERGNMEENDSDRGKLAENDIQENDVDDEEDKDGELDVNTTGNRVTFQRRSSSKS